MAEKTRAELDAYFLTGSRPTQAQYQDLIDSTVNRADDLTNGIIDPTVDFDDVHGYNLFSEYKNTNTGKVWKCTSNSENDAVWINLSDKGDASLTAQSGQDIPITMGDDAGANKVQFQNESGDGVASIDSLGNVSNDGTTKSIGDIFGNLPKWYDSKIYALGDKTCLDGITYRSLANGNNGNNPTSSPTFWWNENSIDAYDEKTTTDSDDLILIEDSTDGLNKKKTTVMTITIQALAKSGDYNEDYIYMLNEITAYGGKFYYSLQDDNGSHFPDLSPLWWAEVINKLGIWSAAVTYSADELTTFGGRIYKSLVGSNINFIPGATGNNSKWKIINSQEEKSGVYYGIGDIVINSAGQTLKSKTNDNNNAALPSDFTNWVQLPDINNEFDEMTEPLGGTEYFLVTDSIDNDKVKRKQVVGIVDAFIQDGKLPILPWDDEREYNTNEDVLVAGEIYKSLQDSNTNNDPTTEITWWTKITGNTGGISRIARNYATNPIMLVSERPGDFDSTPVQSDDGIYSIDRFKTIGSNDGQNIVRLSSDQPTDLRYSKSLKVTSYEDLTNNVMGIEQRLDDLVPFVYGGGDWVFSAYVKSNHVNARLVIFDGDSNVTSDPHTGAGDWELLTVTRGMALSSSISIKAVLCDIDGDQVAVDIDDYIETTGWNFHSGTERIEFDYRDEESERWECMRYCWTFKPTGTRLGILGFGRASTTQNAINFFMHNPRKMVNTPVVSVGGGGDVYPVFGDWIIESNDGKYGDIDFTGGYPAFNQMSKMGFEMTWVIKDPPGTGYNLWVVGQTIFLRMNTDNAYILVDADY